MEKNSASTQAWHDLDSTGDKKWFTYFVDL